MNNDDLPTATSQAALAASNTALATAMTALAAALSRSPDGSSIHVKIDNIVRTQETS